MQKRLFRSKHNRIIFGVLGGMGEYFNTDPVLIRVIAVLITIFTGGITGIIAYLILALVIPEEKVSPNNP